MKSENAPVEREDVEILAGRLKIDAATLAGMMEMRRWRPGKSVSLKEVQKAAEDFRSMAAG